MVKTSWILIFQHELSTNGYYSQEASVTLASGHSQTWWILQMPARVDVETSVMEVMMVMMTVLRVMMVMLMMMLMRLRPAVVLSLLLPLLLLRKNCHFSRSLQKRSRKKQFLLRKLFSFSGRRDHNRQHISVIFLNIFSKNSTGVSFDVMQQVSIFLLHSVS